MTSRIAAPLIAVLVGLSLAAQASAWATEDPAHALAEKFAAGAAKEDAARKREAEEKRRAAEEAEMLTRARAEAEARKAAAEKARADAEAEDARRAAEQKAAEDKRIAGEMAAKEARRRLDEEQRIAREKFIADQLEAEAAQRAEQKAAAERRITEEKAAEEARSRLAEEQRAAREKFLADRERQAAEAQRMAEEKAAEATRLAEEKRIADERKALAEERERTHQRLTEKLLKLEQLRRDRREAEARTQAARIAAEQEARPDAPPVAAAPAAPRVAAAAPVERVTVLLALDVHVTGIRRYGKKTADPVLCAGPTCWIATGSDRAALSVRRGDALGPANTLGRRAGACNQHLACVFRDMDVDALTADIQPIDLRIMRHDRREPLRLSADTSCRRSNGGALVCDKLFTAKSWRAWVVPERLAAEIGPAGLEAALRSGLVAREEAALAPRRP